MDPNTDPDPQKSLNPDPQPFFLLRFRQEFESLAPPPPYSKISECKGSLRLREKIYTKNIVHMLIPNV
jgi:hypothetical protein